MAIPFIAAATSVKLIGRAKAFFSSKWFWAALLLVAVAGGTFYTINNWKNDAVATSTKAADTKATVKSLEADSAVNQRIIEREQPLIILREQTIKDYSNARATLQAQPQAERNAPAPRVIIDTLNQLDRLRSARSPDSVPDAEVPVG